LISESIRGLHFEIDQRFCNCNRDHDPDQKPFRKIRSAISGSKSDREKYFSIAIAIRRNLVVSSHLPGLMTCRIEKPIRINQTLIEKFSADFDFSFSIKP
jgi:hypothetical protein